MTSRVLVAGIVGLALAGAPIVRARAAQQDGEEAVFDEAPAPTSAEDRAAREAKNRRYDTGGPDLTGPDARGFASYWPRVDPEESALVVVGTVRSRQPYLSADRGSVYTELVVDVEEVLRVDADISPTAKTVTMDRTGGMIRLASGQMVRGTEHICYLGWPEAGKRYVLYARKIHGGADLDFYLGYELADGRATRVDDLGEAKADSDRVSAEADLLADLRAWGSRRERSRR